MATELKFDEILRVLSRHKAEFIIVGGIAAILHGSPLTTQDLDIVYLVSDENNARLHEALAELKSFYLDPAGRHIEPTVQRLAAMKIHLLRTKFGRLDVLSSVGEDLDYERLVARSREFDVAGREVQVLNLEAIIESKEHADRPKDRYQLMFLRQLAEEADPSLS